jgi:hypothetical protein
MRNRRFRRTFGLRRRTKKLFWVRYSGFLELVPGAGLNPNDQILLDPTAFEPSSTGTYPSDINREVTIHRIKMHYVASCEQFGPTDGSGTLVLTYWGIHAGARLPVPSPSNGAAIDQRRDWLDLWMDSCTRPPAGTGSPSFNSGEQGQTSRDVRTKRTLKANEGLFLCGKMFPQGPAALGDDTRWWLDFHVSMLISRAT